MEIIEYRLEFCPLCDLLSETLKSLDIKFEIRNMQDSESIADLLVDGVFTQNAPVLKIGNDYFYDEMLIKNGKVVDAVIHLIKTIQ